MLRGSIVASVLAIVVWPGSFLSQRTTQLWYDAGHRLVVRIAELRLTPHTASAVKDILAGQGLGQASLWADQIRGQRRETAALHFVNIPLNAVAYDSARDCLGGHCIIAEIQRDRQVLADSTSGPIERGEALRFLIHFIADLHQPLHVSDNGDKGGNLRQVTLVGSPYNLHEVWDGELIKASHLSEAEYFSRLRDQMDSLDLSSLERGTVVDWAMEGHHIARERAYQIPRGGQLDDAYVAAGTKAVDLALIKAGVRLAKVLNEALEGYDVSQTPPASLGAQIYTDREALAHVGEIATVVGTVVSVHRSHAGNIYLNFGADYPHQTFTGAVLGSKEPGLQNLDSLKGKRVGVRGLIKNYKGQAEIIIESIDQIVSMP